MSSTWKYVSEARGHLVEVYEELIGEPIQQEWGGRIPVGEAAMGWSPPVDDDFDEQRLQTLIKVVDALEAVGKERLCVLLVERREAVVDYLSKTVSERKRMKFASEADRMVFLCLVLWHLNLAIEWLDDRVGEGLLQGGSGYRQMTAYAAQMATRKVNLAEKVHEMLPEENGVVDNTDEDDVRLEKYQRWSYIVIDNDSF